MFFSQLVDSITNIVPRKSLGKMNLHISRPWDALNGEKGSGILPLLESERTFSNPKREIRNET